MPRWEHPRFHGDLQGRAVLLVAELDVRGVLHEKLCHIIGSSAQFTLRILKDL